MTKISPMYVNNNLMGTISGKDLLRKKELLNWSVFENATDGHTKTKKKAIIIRIKNSF